MKSKVIQLVTLFLLVGVFWSATSFAAEPETAYKLKPKYMINNFNFDMSSATITEFSDHIRTMGEFRTNKDYNLMYWESEDRYSHPDLKYKTDPDFTNVILEYSYKISGHAMPMNGEPAPAIVITTSDNKNHYVRLWNYIIDRPKDDWELGASELLALPYSFPSGRTPGSANGTTGTIRLDFNNLYSGWAPFIKDQNNKWIPNPEWTKIPVKNIKRIEWIFVPVDYNSSSDEVSFYDESQTFEVEFTNWNVYGNTELNKEKSAAPVSSVRLSEGYDDAYHLTPERLIDEYEKLGFGDLINFYIGAAHYYDKEPNSQNELELAQEKPFNLAFEEWFNNYTKRLSIKDIDVIASVSMEHVNAPESWWQRTWDGTPAQADWGIAPKLLSFTNSDVQEYYKSVVLGLAEIQSNNKREPIIQLGESWWWYIGGFNESPPTFYDDATREKYRSEYGEDMYEFKSVHASIKGHEKMLYWLSDQNGLFTLLLRDAVKAEYPNSKFTTLFYVPTVADIDSTPEMVQIVNLPIEQWKYPNLDFFMIEDYEYLQNNNMSKHRQALQLAQQKLKYPVDQVHYIAGSALNMYDDVTWGNINQSLNNGINMGFDQVYIWAYPQVKERGWHPPQFVESSLPAGVYSNNDIKLKLHAENTDEIWYTLDGTDPKINGVVYDNSSVFLSKDTIINAVTRKNGEFGDTFYFNYLFNTQDYKYDLSNQLISQTLYMGEQKYRIDYKYDPNGNTLSKQLRPINSFGYVNIIEPMASNNDSAGISDASSNFGESYLPYKAFDQKDTEQAWITNGTASGWLSYEFDTPKNIIAYSLLPRHAKDTMGSAPMEWTFEGFNGTSWDVLSSETDVTDWQVGVKKIFKVHQSEFYKKYRINIKTNNGHWFTSIGEFELYSGDDSLNDAMNLVTKLTSNNSDKGRASASNDFGQSYMAYKAFDHVYSEQSWISNGTVQGWLAYEFVEPTKVMFYKIMARSDGSTLNSAPKAWTLEGFDGEEWVVISTESNIEDWQLNKKKTFVVQNPGTFKSYRLNIQENNGHSWTSVGELELYN